MNTISCCKVLVLVTCYICIWTSVMCFNDVILRAQADLAEHAIIDLTIECCFPMVEIVSQWSWDVCRICTNLPAIMLNDMVLPSETSCRPRGWRKCCLSNCSAALTIEYIAHAFVKHPYLFWNRFRESSLSLGGLFRVLLSLQTSRLMTSLQWCRPSKGSITQINVTCYSLH